MKKLIKTYVDINGIVLNKVTYYLVTFTKLYEFSLFGKVLKQFNKVQEVPFVFKSYEIAKDFCELNPQYKKYCIYAESTLGIRTADYETYKLILNNKVNAYIVWETSILKQIGLHAVYSPSENYPIVFGFIKELTDINLKSSLDINRLKSSPIVNYHVEKLSEIFTILQNDKHHFELIEQ